MSEDAPDMRVYRNCQVAYTYDEYWFTWIRTMSRDVLEQKKILCMLIKLRQATA